MFYLYYVLPTMLKKGFFKVMEKTFFSENFNLEILMLMIIFLNTIIIYTFRSLSHVLSSFDVLASWFLNFSLIPWSVFLTILCLEILNRLRYDSLINLPRSIWKTFQLRYYLKVRVNDNSFLNETFIPQHRIYQKYNQAVKHSCVDIQNNRVIVLIKLPRDIDAQEIAKLRANLVKDSIKSVNQNYIFSNFQRFGNWLQIIGTRQ